MSSVRKVLKSPANWVCILVHKQVVMSVFLLSASKLQVFCVSDCAGRENRHLDESWVLKIQELARCSCMFWWKACQDNSPWGRLCLCAQRNTSSSNISCSVNINLIIVVNSVGIWDSIKMKCKLLHLIYHSKRKIVQPFAIREGAKQICDQGVAVVTGNNLVAIFGLTSERDRRNCVPDTKLAWWKMFLMALFTSLNFLPSTQVAQQFFSPRVPR